MAQKNVETVRAAFASSDSSTASAWWHPEIEWIVAREHPEARTLNGREAVVAYLRDWERVLEDARLEIDTFVNAGTSVVAIGTVRGVGAGSRADVRVPFAFVCTPAE